jgi:1,5-anhydro-D-fructose reductase (1,5-anhydro-D-mannitol-forming)
MKLAGGGPIADVGVHCIDALRYILQDEVVEVVARGFSDRDSGDVEAAATLVLKFSRGTLGTVMVSIRSEYRTPLEVIGEEAALRAMDALNVEHSIQVQLVKGGDVVNRQEVSNTQAYARQVDAFSAALEDGTPFPVPGEEGWKNQVILDAAYRSLNNGTAEKISIATLR